MGKRAKAVAAGGVEERLSALEAAVDELRAQLAKAPSAGVVSSIASVLPSAEQKFWAIEQLGRRHPTDGGVVFAGHVILPSKETYAWQIEVTTGDMIDADWSRAQVPLAALAHPVRLSILKAILEGKRDTQSLQALPEMGTTGQLYHHLKELESAGWVRQPHRGQYTILAERVVPLLTILAACEVRDR